MRIPKNARKWTIILAPRPGKDSVKTEDLDSICETLNEEGWIVLDGWTEKTKMTQRLREAYKDIATDEMPDTKGA